MSEEKILPIWFYIIVFVWLLCLNIIAWTKIPKLMGSIMVTLCSVVFGGGIFMEEFKKSWDRFRMKRNWDKWTKGESKTKILNIYLVAGGLAGGILGFEEAGIPGAWVGFVLGAALGDTIDSIGGGEAKKVKNKRKVLFSVEMVLLYFYIILPLYYFFNATQGFLVRIVFTLFMYFLTLSLWYLVLYPRVKEKFEQVKMENRWGEWKNE